MLGFLPRAELGLRNSLLYSRRLVRGCDGMNGWAWLFAVGQSSGCCLATAFTIYFARIILHLTVAVRSVWSCLCVGLVCGVVKISAPLLALLVHNTLKRNIKRIARSKHQFTPEIAPDFRIQEIPYLPLQLTSNVYMNTCRFIKWMGAQFFGTCIC